MPAAKRSAKSPAPDVEMTNVAAVERDLALLPDGLARGALGVSALTLARELDSTRNSATSKSMCAGRLLDTMRELRSLAPPEETNDELDDIAAARERRRAARGAAAAD